MHDVLGFGGELRRIPGDTVVESAANVDQQIAIVNGIVRVSSSVHTKHMHRERMHRIDAAEAHQRGYDRNIEARGERAQLIAGTAIDDAAAGIN